MIDAAFIDSANTLSQIYNPDPPRDNILYHYTDFAGLHGILESHNLRATYNRVLNDASEQDYAENILHQEQQLLTGGLPKGKAIFDNKRRHFVTCFCESAKLLGMWRAYAGNGGGYCLGFDYSYLKHNMCWPDVKVGQSFPLLVPVHYISAPPSIHKYLEAHFKSELYRDDLSLELPPFFPSMIKHEAFKEEREWRIIALDPPLEHTKFRSGGANIKPYVELSALLPYKAGQKLPIVNVTFGPTLRPEGPTEEIIGWMLKKNGYNGIEVTSSGIPFRQ